MHFALKNKTKQTNSDLALDCKTLLQTVDTKVNAFYRDITSVYSEFQEHLLFRLIRDNCQFGSRNIITKKKKKRFGLTDCLRASVKPNLFFLTHQHTDIYKVPKAVIETLNNAKIWTQYKTAPTPINKLRKLAFFVLLHKTWMRRLIPLLYLCVNFKLKPQSC